MRRSVSRSSLLKKKRGGAVPKPASTRTTVRTGENIYQSLRASTPGTKVLIIRALGGIGDVLMVTPLLRQLKNDFPTIDLTLALDRNSTGAADVYYQLTKNAPFIDHIVDARTVDKRKYDLWSDVTSVCIKYEHRRLPVMNRIDIFSKHVGIPRLADPLPFYQVENDERLWARDVMSASRKKKLILHTASFDGKRSWPAGRNKELLDLLRDERPDIQVLLFDYNSSVGPRPEVLNCSAYSVRQKAALIEQADLFVGPDSGPMHLAGALRKKSLVIFGPIPPSARLNHYASHKAVLAKEKLACMFCWYQRCDIGVKCLLDISARQVLGEIGEIIR
jgi:ADP-heptose:LPS heptosyltransferase